MNPKLIPFISVLLLIFCGGENAWALQSHGAPEGIYVHQMAHLLFSGALGYLYWHTRTTPVIVSRGWKYLQVFCGFLILWNLLAFTGHEALKQLDPADFINKGSWKEQLAGPVSSIKVLYYITKMDHFLNVPALLALVVSLRMFYIEALLEEEK
ncbi:MAG: hypothetical protein ACN4GW_18385 [Desulforhopalus sp.]